MALTLKKWRVFKGLSQQEMADKLNVHVNTYAGWEKNPGKIKIEQAVEIAKKLDVSVDEIFFAE